MPEVLSDPARGRSTASSLVWRATFSELARWWRWRAERRWLVIPREDHRLEIQFDEWDPEYATVALEIHRGDFHLLDARDRAPDVARPRPGWSTRASEPEADCSIPPTIDRETLSLKQADPDRDRLGDRDAAGRHPAVVARRTGSSAG